MRFGCVRSGFDSRCPDKKCDALRVRFLSLPAASVFSGRRNLNSMQLIIKNSGESALTLFRRAGYSFQREENDELSFIRSLSRAGYPRFHVYVRPHSMGYECRIHLDQKRETYGKVTRHHGEYTDEGALGEEIKRLKSHFGELST